MRTVRLSSTATPKRARCTSTGCWTFSRISYITTTVQCSTLLSSCSYCNAINLTIDRTTYDDHNLVIAALHTCCSSQRAASALLRCAADQAFSFCTSPSLLQLLLLLVLRSSSRSQRITAAVGASPLLTLCLHNLCSIRSACDTLRLLG
jgi:hypothetical protein